MNRLLRDALTQLAMAPDDQRRHLAGAVVTDELALDLEHAVQTAASHGVAPPVLADLRDLLDTLDAPPDDPLWSDASLDTHPVWAARDRARRLLEQL